MWLFYTDAIDYLYIYAKLPRVLAWSEMFMLTVLMISHGILRQA